jgi:ComF family protein
VRGVSKSYLIYHLLWAGLDLILPPLCAGCGKRGARWCRECQDTIAGLPEPVCEICGISVNDGIALCADCQVARPCFRALRSWAAFEGRVRIALHRLKYGRDIGLAEALTPQFSQFAAGLGWTGELLVPVPLGPKRLKQRGYNQAELLARPLAMAMGVRYAPDALERVRDTRSQVGLSRTERQDNVRSAFRSKAARVRGRTILLVDDVATTGSTLSSCAEALYASGAQDVLALTVARAMPRSTRGNAR